MTKVEYEMLFFEIIEKFCDDKKKRTEIRHANWDKITTIIEGFAKADAYDRILNRINEENERIKRVKK